MGKNKLLPVLIGRGKCDKLDILVTIFIKNVLRSRGIQLLVIRRKRHTALAKIAYILSKACSTAGEGGQCVGTPVLVLAGEGEGGVGVTLT